MKTIHQHNKIDNNMKKLMLIVLIITPLFLSACQGDASSSNETKNQKETVTKNGDGDKTVVHLTEEQFRKKVVDYKNEQTWNFQGKKPCLVDFYADWCAPCRITSPIIEDLAQQYKGQIQVYKVDVEKEKELAAALGIRGIPTFLYCPLEGKPRMSSGIGQSKEDTRKMFKQNIEKFLLKN
jgi:thioredoxin